MTMRHAGFDTPTGRVRLTEEGGAITALRWDANAPDGETGPAIEAARAQLGEYFAGNRREFDLPLAPRGDALKQRFLTILQAIPFGQTRTYGEIGAELGVGAQTVGQLCGANPIPILIPCHRVLAATGLGGFSGGTGIETKVALLRHEGAAGLLL